MVFKCCLVFKCDISSQNKFVSLRNQLRKEFILHPPEVLGLYYTLMMPILTVRAVIYST
jgi:hypothetical protein